MSKQLEHEKCITLEDEEMVCAKCGKEIKREDYFCPACGNKIEWKPEIDLCAKCGKEIKQGDRFCSACGNKIEWNSDIDCRETEKQKDASEKMDNDAHAEQMDRRQVTATIA